MRAGNIVDSGGKNMFFVDVIVRVILEKCAAVGLLERVKEHSRQRESIWEGPK